MAVADVTAKAIKAEPNTDNRGPLDPLDLEERILELCGNHAKGVTEDIITTELPQMAKDKIMKSLQRLLSVGKIKLLTRGSMLVYQLKSNSSTSNKTKGLEKEEKLVYQIIEGSGNKGIWTREIRSQSNLPIIQIEKVLKLLKSKKLIKNVKCVSAARKNVYMLFDTVPHESLTGGAWYSNEQEFETEFVEILNLKCYQYLQQKFSKALAQSINPVVQRRMSFASVSEVSKFIADLGVSKVQLSETNIEAILDTLVYDGKAERTVELAMKSGTSKGSVKKYRMIRGMMHSPGLACVPCGICPVMSQCSDDGLVSPSKCSYINSWLLF